MTTRARIGAHAVSLLLILAVLVLVQGTAQASCAREPEPSPHAFTGTVVSVEKGGRVATVRTEDGREVTVVGAGDLNSDAATSVDRRYAVGARYEFHPLNSTSPFQDNACTATRQLSGPHPEPVEPREDRLPGWLPVDEDAGPIGYALLPGMLLAAAACAVGGVLAWRALMRSRRSRPTRDPA